MVAVEPESSAVLSTGVAGKHKIQRIGAGFVPQTYDAAVVDRVLPISDDDAIAASRRLSRLPENEGKTIVALLPDTGERYLSTVLYDTENYPIQR